MARSKKRKGALKAFTRFFDDIGIPYVERYDSENRLVDMRLKLAFEVSGKRRCTISVEDEFVTVAVAAGKLGRQHPSGAFSVIEMLTNFRVELKGRKLEWRMSFRPGLINNNGHVYGIFVEIDKDIVLVTETLEHLATGSGGEAPFLIAGPVGNA